MRVTVALYILVYIRKHTNDYFWNCLREVILDLCGVFVFVFDLPKVIFLNQGSSDVYLYFDVFYIYEISTILVQNIYYIFILLCSSYIKVICNTEKYAGEAKNLYIFFCKGIPVYDERGDQQWGFYDLPQKLKLNIVNI